MFRFASPLFLSLLAVIPLAIFIRSKRETRASLKVSSTSFIDNIPASFFLVLSNILPNIFATRPDSGVTVTYSYSVGEGIWLAGDGGTSCAAAAATISPRRKTLRRSYYAYAV